MVSVDVVSDLDDMYKAAWRVITDDHYEKSKCNDGYQGLFTPQIIPCNPSEYHHVSEMLLCTPRHRLVLFNVRVSKFLEILEH